MEGHIFAQDEEIKDAKIKIMSVVEVGKTQRATTYEVMFLCCGAIGLLSHRAVLYRMKGKINTCGRCGHSKTENTWRRKRRSWKRMTDPALANCHPPTWPAPQSAIDMKGFIPR